jgi:hypothetical protein
MTRNQIIKSQANIVILSDDVQYVGLCECEIVQPMLDSFHCDKRAKSILRGITSILMVKTKFSSAEFNFRVLSACPYHSYMYHVDRVFSHVSEPKKGVFVKSP